MLKFVAAALLVFGAAALGWALMYFVQQRHILRSWPRADATVVEAQIVEHPTDGGPLYAAELRFAFAANGQPATGMYVFPHESTSRERKEKQVAQYPVGSQHTIAYDPQSPERVFVRPGYNVEFFVVPVFLAGVAALFGLVAAGMWVAAGFAERRVMRSAA